MSASDFSTVRCACCDEVGHSTRKCPGLKPPSLGFDKGGTRIPDEEEDEAHTKMKKSNSTEINIYITPLKNPRAKKRARTM
jgi:hypothetical protein